MHARTHAFVAVCTTLFVAATAAASAEGMTLKQVASLRSVTDAIDQPGRRTHRLHAFVFPASSMTEDDGGAWSELHVIDARRRAPAVHHRGREHRVDRVDARRVGDHVPRQAGRRRAHEAVRDAGGRGRGPPDRDLGDLDRFVHVQPRRGIRRAARVRARGRRARKKEKDLGFDQYVFEEEWTPRRVYIAPSGEEATSRAMLETRGLGPTCGLVAERATGSRSP
jgi:hypothetical protein